MMDIGCVTDIGNVRIENQDRFLVLLKTVPEGDVLLCAGADGMGGTGSGTVASNTVIHRLQDWCEAKMSVLLKEERVYTHISSSLDRLIEECNNDINEQARQMQISTGTTLSLLFAFKNQIIIKHIGDSRIYLNRENEWMQLTMDHTWEQFEYQRGNDPHNDPEYAKKKNALINALGSGGDCKTDTQILQVGENDRYLLCSDGFYRYLDPEKDMQIIDEEAQSYLNKMAEKIRQTEAKDNFTAVLVINNE